MTGKNDDRPIPRKRTPRPAPDADTDPMDMPAKPAPASAPPAAEKAPSAAEPAKPAPAPVTPAPAKPKSPRATGRRTVPASVPVTPKDPEERAVVQLGVRVSVKVDQHLEEVRAATGRTRRELVESAILALRVPSSS